MKNTILFTLFLLIFSDVIAQNTISLTLKDGSVINGIGRFSGIEKILLRKTENSEKEIYDYKTVKKMTMYFDSDGSEENYEYKVIEASGISGDIKLLEIILTGNVNLYRDVTIGTSTYMSNGFGGGFGVTGSSKTTYYISNTGSDIATDLRMGNTYSKRFKKIAIKYFKSCPDLLEKINNKYFKRNGIGSVVKYYNENCGN
ncbi:MAG: hypothetical protein OEM04_10795 [Flavobacteriaceae bacterium]|nr:hypothetical protein [Flavobacteriaceae bacterium]